MSFLVQIFKSHPLEPRAWSNDYVVDAGTLETGVAALAIIYAAESTFHNAATTFTHALVSSTVEFDNVFQSVPLNSPGERANPADNLPLWNTVRLDVTATGGGRPGRKFYRLPLGESDVANYIIDSGLAGEIKSAMDGVIADLAALGVPWLVNGERAASETNVFAKVQMRQLHRKRRRTPTP